MTAVGIDLGTTYSAVAAVDEAGRPRILPSRDGAATTPSVVYFDGEAPLVGRAARLAGAAAPRDCVELVKRHLAEPAWRHETAAGTAYTAEQISALILRSLADDAAAALGHPVHEAVITVPAYFDDARRRATMDAGQIAGLTVLRVLNEPTAAALAFGHGAHRGETMLVYDLGGGTFDVTAVRVDGGGCEVLATDGDRNLGGFDFDNALMAHVDEAVRAGGGPSLLDGDLLEAALRDRCEHAKRALSTLPDTAVRITVGGREFAVPISRPRFEELTGGLLRRTEEIVRDVVDAAGAAPAAVLLVGGSTRMPMVGAMVERVTGARTDRSVHPDEAVALGAAVQAYELSRPVRGPRRAVVQDVTAHGVGLLARSTDTGGQLNSVVIPRNTPIPCEGRRRYRTLAENQREILLEVTEGEDEDPRYCSIVGSGWVSIPPRAEATLLDVVLTYDEDGMIAVDVVDVDSGEPLGDFVLDRQSNLDARQVERMRAALRAVTDRPA